MRKTAKSIDDLPCAPWHLASTLIAEMPIRLHRKRLISALLAMLEGKVKKSRSCGRHGDVESLFDRDSGKSARDGIGCNRRMALSRNRLREN